MTRLLNTTSLKLEDLPAYQALRARHAQIVAHVEQQASFLAPEAREVILASLRDALDAELREHFKPEKMTWRTTR